MPKAASTTTSKGTRSSLRRNQACRSCRKRKLKCDAARPHCGTCVRHWQTLISVPAPVGYVHPTEPQCVYDPVDGFTLSPDTDPVEKIRILEEEISKLRVQLQEKSSSITTAPSVVGMHGHGRCIPGCASSSSAATSQLSALGSGPPLHTISSASNLLCPAARNDNHSPDLECAAYRSPLDAVSNIVPTGWNPDLPDPHTLGHYIDTFFRCDPCGPRILHRPSFLTAMHLHPQDPAFPHSAVLHAICACASRWSSQSVAMQPDGSRKDEFAEYHASKTRQYIDRTIATGEDILQVVQACNLLSWYFYQEGRWVEVWIFAGFQIRVAIPLRLNYPGTFSTQSDALASAYLAPPKDVRDLETRRRTWWMAIIFDRIVSAGGWVHAIDEKDIGTELPLRGEDFCAENLIPNNPQDMCTEDIFTTHLPKYTDTFLLFIKVIMMFGKVTDFNVRGGLWAPTSKHQDPFVLPGFRELDTLLHHDFLDNLPHSLRFNLAVTDMSEGGLHFDTDLYMVHVIPHAATITLHNPYMDLSDLQRTSTTRCIKAAQAILSAYFMLSVTSLDVTRLHPFITMCWYLSAAVQIQVCKYFIEIGDYAKEAQIWGEINVLREAMLNYGRRSPIGTQQEALLRGLMKEVVQLTSQERPLEVGLPLYPCSHATLFVDASVPRDRAPAAPLPDPANQCELPKNIFQTQLAASVIPVAPSLYPMASWPLDIDDPPHTESDLVTWN